MSLIRSEKTVSEHLYRGSRTIRLFAKTEEKKSSSKSNLKLALALAVSGPIGYGFYSYCTDLRFREICDETYLIYFPWILGKFTKWFPMDMATPYRIRRVNIPSEIKEVLCDAFTDLDLQSESGMSRKDTVGFFQSIIGSDIPQEYIEKLYAGEYLDMCLKEFRHPNRHALGGEDKVMSIDEFAAFSAIILPLSHLSLEEMKSRIMETKERILKEKGDTARIEMQHDSFDPELGYKSLLVPIARNVIESRYHMDEKAISEYNSHKVAVETKETRRKELEEEIEVLNWDIKQVNEELKREKWYGGEDSKETIASLSNQLADLNTTLREAKNELYYL